MKLGAACAVVLICLVVAPTAGADTFVVTKRTDPAPGPCTSSDCSLREAIRAANALPGRDRIVLPSRKPYNLSRPSSGEDGALDGDLDITNDGLRIVHPGPGRATIDANGIDRVFEIFAGAPTRLVKLRITGGDQPSSSEGNGGGIRTDASLWLLSSAVIRNHATGSDGVGGGIQASGGKLTIVESSISYNEAESDSGAFDVGNHGVVIERSSVIGNVAQFAGVAYMYGDGSSVIRNSTIARNRSAGETGGIYFSETGGTLLIRGSTISGNVAGTDGGGLSARNGEVRVENSTVAENRAGGSGGGIWALTPLELNAVTVARNVADSDQVGGGGGAGLYNATAPVTVENSLIALNRLGDGTRNDCGGMAFTSLGQNLISTTGPANACEGFDQQGDLVRSTPRLGDLAANGGRTKTIALRRGSPALNRADPASAPDRDQRGVRRNDPDIGAFERS